MKMKDITLFEQLNILNIYFLNSSLSSKSLSLSYFNKNSYEEQIDIILYENEFQKNSSKTFIGIMKTFNIYANRFYIHMEIEQNSNNTCYDVLNRRFVT